MYSQRAANLKLAPRGLTSNAGDHPASSIKVVDPLAALLSLILVADLETEKRPDCFG
jgi:hypothetical protein